MQIIAIMGAAGCGKSHSAAAVAAVLGYRFVEGDDLHPQANIDKMQRGIALEDQDRMPWLDAMHAVLVAAQAADESVVLAASLLKEAYRERVFAGLRDQVLLVYLQADQELLEQRMQQRQHFMPLSLLPSQLDCLEEPVSALYLNAADSLEDIVSAVYAAASEKQ